MKIKGIDISHWQGNFNLSKAKSEGFEFVVVKGGGGDDGLYVDSKFERNYNEAKSLGMPVGVYWYSKALSVEEALKEADYFYANCLKGKQFELPVYIDIEEKAQLNLGKDKLTAIALAWMVNIEARGYWTGIYSTTYYFNTYFHDEKLQKFAHWIAQWNTVCTYEGKEGVLGMWQYGGETNLLRSNIVAGVVCDQNYMLIDYPKEIKSAGLNGYSKNPKKTNSEIAREVIQGKWGNGSERRIKLEKAGYSYNTIQSLVNDILR